MNFTKTFGMSLVAVLTTTGAYAAGIERQTFSANYLYESGNSAEVSYADTTPDIRATIGGVRSPRSVAQGFQSVSASFKSDIIDGVALGLRVSDGAYGVNIDYTQAGITDARLSTNARIPAAAGGPNVLLARLPIANVESTEIQLLGKYQITPDVAAFGGIKNVEASGNLALAGQRLVLSSAEGQGLILGASYSLDDIALRVILSYEQDIDLSLPTTENGTAVQNTTASVGDAIQLQFQTGIAANTLLFGKIRQANWGDNQVTLPANSTSGETLQAANGNRNVSSFEDKTSFELGVGYRVTNAFSVAFSFAQEPGDSGTTSLLAPVGQSTRLSLGARYTANDALSIGAGVTQITYETANASFPGNPRLAPLASTISGVQNAVPATFENNSTTAYGISIRYKF